MQTPTMYMFMYRGSKKYTTMKLTKKILSDNFVLSELEEIYVDILGKTWYRDFVVNYNTDQRPMSNCLWEYLTEHLINATDVEELVKRGFLSSDVLGDNYDKVSHYYDKLDNTYSIDAWKQGKDEGKVVAIIDVDTLSVTYLVDEAKYSQSVVYEIKKVLRHILESNDIRVVP